jgi:hypothetical protein
MTEPTSVKDELAAMNKIVRILDKVDPSTADRIANWVYDRYGADSDIPEASDVRS